MGADTKIGWCHDTFNAWIGCAKVSPACKHCYAADNTFTRVQRAQGRELWGVDADRHFFKEKHWREPLKWNRDAEKAGERRRVLCGSMMDVLELHSLSAINVDMNLARRRLFALIHETPWLDWLLLTKRPENFAECFPEWVDGCPPNVWFGTTVENQEYADLRIPHLLKIPARIRFLSCEPILGSIDLSRWIKRVDHCKDCGTENSPTKEDRCPSCQSDSGLISTWGEGQAERFHSGERYESAASLERDDGPALHWVIAGGESGANHREHQLEHSRSLRDQCKAAGVAYFFKQLGEKPTEQTGDIESGTLAKRRLPIEPRSKGEKLEEIPEDLRIRELPNVA